MKYRVMKRKKFYRMLRNRSNRINGIIKVTPPIGRCRDQDIRSTMMDLARSYGVGTIDRPTFNEKALTALMHDARRRLAHRTIDRAVMKHLVSDLERQYSRILVEIEDLFNVRPSIEWNIEYGDVEFNWKFVGCSQLRSIKIDPAIIQP